MSKYYYVTRDQLKELEINTDRETILCLSLEPFKNWIVGFDIFDTSSPDSEEMTLGMDFEVLKLPEDVPEIEISNRTEELGEFLRDLTLEVLNNHLQSSLDSI